jgi:hypothetical protein
MFEGAVTEWLLVKLTGIAMYRSRILCLKGAAGCAAGVKEV